MRKKVLVLGSNFGGLTAALAVQRELHGDVDVRVMSPSDRFVFNPSLIWLPFGKRDPADPLLSPLFADSAGLPPMLIHVGGDEVMLDDSRKFAEKAKAAGVPVTYKMFDGMWHVFHTAGQSLPESRKAIDEIGDFVRALYAATETA